VGPIFSIAALNAVAWLYRPDPAWAANLADFIVGAMFWLLLTVTIARSFADDVDERPRAVRWLLRVLWFTFIGGCAAQGWHWLAGGYFGLAVWMMILGQIERERAAKPKPTAGAAA
jgi:hypothetical protein